MSNINVYCKIKPSNNNKIEIINNSLYIKDNSYDFAGIFIDEEPTAIYNSISLCNSFTFILYGQTGSGKTHTLLNDENGLLWLFLSNVECDKIFLEIFEIYNEEVYDLINNKFKCNLYQQKDSLLIHNLSRIVIYDKKKMRNKIEDILTRRETKSTINNSTSSRSHLVIKMKINDQDCVFIDLAGSERLKIFNNKEILRESININKGLLGIGSVINSLYNKNRYIPYRSSKLTRILKEFLDMKVIFMGCIKVDRNDYVNESLNTLNYMQRLSKVKNICRINRNVMRNINNSPVKTNNYKIEQSKIVELEKKVKKLSDELIKYKKIYLKRTLENSCEKLRRVSIGDKKVSRRKVTFSNKKCISTLIHYVEGSNLIYDISIEINENILTYKYKDRNTVLNGFKAINCIVKNNYIFVESPDEIIVIDFIRNKQII